MAEAVASVRIQGADALILRLSLLEKGRARNILRGGLRAASKPLIARARQLVPVSGLNPRDRFMRGRARGGKFGRRPGDLQRSIRFSSRGFSDGSLYAEVKAGGRQAFYAHMVERGTRPHEITPRNARALAAGGKPVAKVRHPGARAARYMERAAAQAARPASEAFRAYVAARLQLALDGK